jgi:hypothetical protein
MWKRGCEVATGGSTRLLALAGLKRLGLAAAARSVFSVDEFAGRRAGRNTIETAPPTSTRAICRPINDGDTMAALTAALFRRAGRVMQNSDCGHAGSRKKACSPFAG